MELGLKPRKTYRDDPFPSMPDEMVPHFIRGYFDGDGSSCITNEGYLRVSLIGTINFIHGMRKKLVELAGMQFRQTHITYGKTASWAKVVWGAVADCKKFYDFIYPAGYSYCLARKKAVFDNYFESHATE
jgi:hypothetical protein